MARPQLGIRIDPEAYELLKRLAPHHRSKGAFISRLLFEYERSLYDRRRFREMLGEVPNSIIEEHISV